MSETRESFVGKLTQKAVLFGPDGDVLVTEVDDHWELPGGTFEYGETLVGGLRRELREELAVDAVVGPPVEAVYGGWLDAETGDPMVTLVYRCETDDEVVELNDEHDDYEWVDLGTAVERVDASLGRRFARAVERAAEFDGSEPFASVADPYADAELTRDEVLERLAEARETDRFAQTDE